MRPGRSLQPAAEVALAGVTLAAVAGMSRLFAGGDWLGPLLLNAVAAHAVATWSRRRGWSLPLVAGAMAVGAALVVTWTGYGGTTAAGLPTGDTWAAMAQDLEAAWLLYQEVVAPAPAEPGFLLASGVAVWVIAYIADWAAFRLWVPFEATLPAGTLFLFTSLLGADRGRSWAVAVYAAAVLAFLLVQRLARQEGSSHWVGERRVLGHRWLLTVGGGLGIVAVVVGVTLGPAVPGADSAGVIDPSELGDSDDARDTISPLVDIRSRLVDQANVEVFTVQSSQPSYWRLTSLERFDGEIWSSSGSYGEAGGELPRSVEVDVPTELVEQTFTIRALAAIWLPAAYEPRAVAAEGAEGAEVRYDEDSATLIVDDEVPSSDGLVYRVTSASPRITPEVLDGSAGAVPDDIRDRYLQLENDLTPRVRELAASLTAGAASPYQQARALQDHLRTFTYDLGIGPGHDNGALEAFLFETQRGYCEQFAGAFAALARSVGLPARVAVGFTQGERDLSQPGRYVVRGEHAHAWPEVYLAGVGWVPFEPTPGRGMPFAESYTEVAPAQAATNDPTTATTAPPTTPPASAGPSEASPSTTLRDPEGDLQTGGDTPDGVDAGREGWATRYLWRPATVAVGVVALLLAAYVLIFPAGLVVRRRLRRRGATTPVERVELAWREAVEQAMAVGYTERRSATYRERAAALADAVRDAAAEAFTLAALLEAASYSAEGVDDDAAAQAREATGRVAEAVRASTTRRARVRHWLDPRPLTVAWRTERRARQRRITTTAGADLEVQRELVGSRDRG